ncbi:unnamed protein product [Ceutorhynchus assimilis]|uniref:TROVE domain-containing protein n=1 Tax=Ceutorhynchus assimilis TaxID=467358 RepID=A0A9N9MTG4_9CUCU|nr:unnamed protein product [Ceutorhynchus assimilis]
MTSSQSLEDRLKRLIYLNSADPQFIVGDPDVYQKNLGRSSIEACIDAIKNDLNEIFSILDAANKDNHLPRRSNLFFILANLAILEQIKPEQKSKITAKVLELCQSDEEFFMFIKYYTERKPKSKMPSSIEKLVRKYYTKKSPLELAQSVASCNKMHTWTHKDLIKLAHFKSDTPLKNVVVNYILNKKLSDKATDEELEVLDIILKSDKLKRTNEVVEAVPILTTHKFTMNQVSSRLHENAEVWSAAIQNMSIQQILPCIEKLHKLHLIKPETTIRNHLSDLLTSPEKVKASKIHPIEVFTYMKRLEKGGKPINIKLLNYLQNEKKLGSAELEKVQTRTRVKKAEILKILNKCFELACSNVSPTNKRFLVTIDVASNAKEELCIGNKVLSLLEAACAYAIVLLRVEKDVMIATHKDDKIELLSIEKNISFATLLKKVEAKTTTYSSLYGPVEWAASEKKHVDVFVNFIHNNMKIRFEPIVRYRSKVNLPNAKFVTFAPVKKYLPLWVDLPTNVLDILGFDATSCKVAECFFRGAFC